ncbi:type II inositol 3,4-bisphosphate 4-phosphatase [Sinocyclocheilus grahami]|uniref:type II inositol 3,4-bisphosphate 4-phosphatase n=1 Tax=Sinocyclocheilus grahami TaxID=75366 RepID=UPI0007AC917C|nr:PREDICTED: type II inositol 3,4-bisphosphate 4-phosphatase [Sinocyclocheilus grahami]
MDLCSCCWRLRCWGTRDPVFLTGVSFPPDWPVYSETLIKLSVYGVNDGQQQTSNFLGSSSFSVADLLQSKDQQLSLSLRTADDSATVGTVVVSRMKMGEIEDGEVDHFTTDMHRKCTLVYESSHGSVNDKDNGPIMNAVFKNAVCKVYRFQTVDSKWMLVREQMAECTLSFSIPKQLIALYIQEDTCRIQELKDLGELSPHWDNLRKDVISRYDQIIKEYQDTLAELEKLTGPSFKPSCSKGQKYLEFIPINLHTQRMRVTCPRKTDSFYDVVTVGAPAAHSQGFKNGGLQKLLSKYESEKKSYSTAYQCIYYPPEQTAKAREILCVVSQLQPHISALADQLLQTAQQSSSQPLRDVLKSLEEKTEQFVHALKDELVKSALLALHAARPGYVSKSQSSAPSSPAPATADPHPSATEKPHSVCNNVDGSQTPPRESRASPVHSDSIPHHKEYDEEEWDRVWASVAKSLNCVIALVDKLQEQDNNNQESAPSHPLADVITSHSPDPPVTAAVWWDQLGILVQSLKECVADVAERARRSMSFVLLQEAVCSTAQGLQLQQRRDAVFSQALAALACGFVMRLYAGLEDKGFLRQLHAVGLVAQFESLLSTYNRQRRSIHGRRIQPSHEDISSSIFCKYRQTKEEELEERHRGADLAISGSEHPVPMSPLLPALKSIADNVLSIFWQKGLRLLSCNSSKLTEQPPCVGTIPLVLVPNGKLNDEQVAIVQLLQGSSRYAQYAGNETQLPLPCAQGPPEQLDRRFDQTLMAIGGGCCDIPQGAWTEPATPAVLLVDRYTVEVPLPHHAFQTLPDELRQGKPLRVLPVLFNVGINEQQTIAERFGDISLQERINQKNFEILEGYYKSLTNTLPSECLPCFQTQTDIKELLDTLGQNVVTKKRKNVEILWLAGMICRRMNGIRFTSCKSAKDRTSMSVTLEQCSLLRDEHQLNKDYFVRALDCMRSGLLAQGEVAQWDDPEAGSVAINKPASRHFYPIALLLVSSHLLVVWLILSLVFLLAKYQ